MSDALHVLHVCTGNLCRSPLAEHLMRAGLVARLGDAAAAFVVTSAGTMGHEGEPMEPFAREVLAERGLDGADFRVRQLTAEQIGRADLILAVTRQHRLAVAELDPGAVGRTFTLREYARLAEGVSPADLPHGAVARARALVALLATRRSPAARPRDDDLADPYQGPKRGFEACAGTVEAALRSPLDLLVT